MHRDRITKQGSRLIRRAAMDRRDSCPGPARGAGSRDRSPGGIVAMVAAVRRQLEFAFHALLGYRVRGPQGTRPVAT